MGQVGGETPVDHGMERAFLWEEGARREKQKAISFANDGSSKLDVLYCWPRAAKQRGSSKERPNMCVARARLVLDRLNFEV